MKFSRKKKLIIIIVAIILCILVGIFISINYTNKINAKIENETVNKSDQVVVKQFGQEITLHYNTSNTQGPLETTVDIYLNKDESISYQSNGNFVMPDIKLIYQKDGLECYEWSDKSNCLLTYQYKSSKIKGYPNTFEKPEDELLYPVAKQEFMTHDYRKIKLFSELLVKQNDKEAIELLKKYANNSFTQQDDEANADNKVAPNEITALAKSLIIKYNL